jgi:NAD(P)-dependent dehydrogenase (short-subunit alcohol dehydrogenase family)
MKHSTETRATYLITGGTTGIGLAAAQLLLGDGARVIVTGRNPETLTDAREILGSEAVVLRSDSGSLDDAQTLADLVRPHAEILDGVFLNAGVGQFGPWETLTPAQFETMFAVNVRGPFFQLQSVVPLLRNPSAVVLNASVAGLLGLPATSVYAASKAALASLGRTLASELAPRGVRVNTISPGPITTPLYGKLGLSAETQRAYEESTVAGTLLKRFGLGGEVARLVRFLLSSDSSFIVGEEIVIDGGIRHT